LIEPQLELDKEASPQVVEAGTTVDYTISIENPFERYGAAAFDLLLTDMLDEDVTLLPGSFVVERVLLNNAGAELSRSTLTDGVDYGLTTTANPAGDSFDLTLDKLLERQRIEISYQALVDLDVAANKTLENTADLIFDTTPEGAPGEANDDGGAADSDDREYSLSVDEEVVTRSADMTKDIVDGSSSYAETSGTDLGIGEEITYEFTITIPDGSIEDLVHPEHR